MVEDRNYVRLEQLLASSSPEFSATLAIRAALKVLPLVALEERFFGQYGTRELVILDCFRTIYLSSVSAKHSVLEIDVMLSAMDFGRFASAVHYSSPAADAAISVVSAANSVLTIRHDPPSSASSAGDAANSAALAINAAAYNSNSLYATDAWQLVQIDRKAIDSGVVPWSLPLWGSDLPGWVAGHIVKMGALLLAEGAHWQVFLDWYQDRLHGDAAAAIHGRSSIREMEIEIGTISNADWEKGAKHVFGLIREIQERYWGKLMGGTATLEEIASIASPTSALTVGKIDIAPNPEIDSPVDFDGLKELPATQTAISDVLLASLPGNTPPGMKNALGQYRAELAARGAYPVVGILRAMYAMICAERSASEADIWLAPSMLAGFGAFDQNHTLLIAHFPLQKKADEILSRLKVDEEKAAGSAFAEPFRVAVEFARWAQENGVATDDVLKYVKAMREVAEDVARLPVPAGDLSTVSAAESVLGRPTERQRVLGSAIGYFERTYHLLGTTAGIGGALADPSQYLPLMEKVRYILDWLLSLASF